MEQWWRPDRLAARRANLAARGRILAAVREFFAERGFVEVDTPALQVSPGLEPHLAAFATALHDPRAGTLVPRFLHTSPEFAMKKLLVGGEPLIWQLAHAFRDGERSATHHPEFAMLEWYRAGATYLDLMEDCEALLRAARAAAAPAPAFPHERNAIACGLDADCASFETPAARAPQDEVIAGHNPHPEERPQDASRRTPIPIASGHGGGLTWQGKKSDVRRPFERLTVADAFARHAGIDILATAPDPACPDFLLLAEAAAASGIAPHPGDDWESLYFRIFLERIEPHLGSGAPTILYDYPASLAALSRLKPGDRRLAERFELYVCGLELANAFSELTDPDEQRARFVADQRKKFDLYGQAYPVDEGFLAALDHGLPASAGIALGFDRLVMLCTGACDIEEVLWAPVG